MLTRRTLLASAGAALLPTPAVHAQEAAWPSRPIKVLLPSSPGAASDATARPLYDPVPPLPRQPRVTDDPPRPPGTLAPLPVTHAPPDGVAPPPPHRQFDT